MTIPAYEIIRSARRTIALEVTPDCRVLVRAPVRLNRKEIDDFVVGHALWLEKHLERQQNRQATHPEPNEQQREDFIRRAMTELPCKIQRYSALMGLYPAGVTITSARKRFGSCSGKNRICFSWRLMQYPEEAIDYVVVHELAHIRHKNHSKAFYDCIEQVLPDWRERRALLKE